MGQDEQPTEESPPAAEPSPSDVTADACKAAETREAAEVHEAIVQDILRRVRDLIDAQGTPTFSASQVLRWSNVSVRWQAV